MHSSEKGFNSGFKLLSFGILCENQQRIQQQLSVAYISIRFRHIQNAFDAKRKKIQ